MDRHEMRYKALKLAIEYYKDKPATDSMMEEQAKKFYNYISSGRLTSRPF